MDRVSYAGGMTSDPDDALSWEGDDAVDARGPARRGPRRARPESSPRTAVPSQPATAQEQAPTAERPTSAASTSGAVASDEPAPSSVASGSAAPGSAASGSVTSADRGAQSSETDRAAIDDEAPAGLSTAMLLLVGVVGGIYLLYTAGWIIGGLRLQPLASFLVADAMFLPWFVLAIAAPALWFLATWVLTRGRASWIRVAVLLAGVVLLVPWPFVTVGVIGA